LQTINMRAVVASRYGRSEVLHLETVPVPELTANSVLVRNRAVGVNFMDINQREGRVPNKGGVPFVLGLEGAGEVMKVGPGAETKFQIGDRVAYLSMGAGAYSEVSLVPAQSVVKIPGSVSFEQACTAMMQGLTAHYLATDICKVQPGDRVLVHAAAGGVGSLLCQMLKHLGAYVIGAVGSKEKVAEAQRAGADAVIVNTEEDLVARVNALTEGQGVKVVYDNVGKATFQRSLDCLTTRGYLVFYGASSGSPDPFDPAQLAKKSAFLTRPVLFHYIATPAEFARRTNEIFSWAASGVLQLTVRHIVPLEQASAAHDAVEGRRTVGKTVLSVSTPPSAGINCEKVSPSQ